MEKHRKHAQLIKRNYGNFAANEIAILGVKCSIISDLVQEMAEKLQKRAKIAYLDASHNNEISAPILDNFTFHHSGNLVKTSATELNDKNKILFSEYDLLFINGNHYQGDQQILILDNEKKDSVLKRIDQLNNIQFIITLNENSQIFDFLIDKYPNIENLKIYSLGEIDKITSHIENLILQKIAPVQGLVLAGGKSIRMGTDKGLLDYFGKSQRIYSVELLEKLNLKTFLSVRKEQNIDDTPTVEDVFIGLGPFGAICSAFQSDPNSAWLVLATDLPFVDEQIIQQLLEKRDHSKIATAIKGKSKKFPEPLISIWEPKAYPVMLNYLAQGISCPRKVLINSDVKIVEIDDDYITNVNTPEEFEAVKKEIKS
jgi:molybdopterin-guanine dinucleotide biosynthesis protein A